MSEIKIPTWLYKTLSEIIGLNDETIRLVIEGAGEEAVQRHALQTIWIMSKRTKLNNPPGWFTMSLRYDWKPPADLPEDWKPKTFSFTFRLTDNEFMKLLQPVGENEITILKGVQE
jgi:hypothetical protein